MTGFTKVKEVGKGGPDRLIAAVILAFIVMLFINGFIGSMGGVPAFVAFSMIFYWVRTRAVAAKFPAETDKVKRTLAGLMTGYASGYLLLWGLFRILMTVSRATGWGNINGVTALAFVKEMLAVPIWEKGAYLLAGILMFLLVLSLFPLTVIRKKTHWILYALGDGALFTILCAGIGILCEKTSGGNRMSRPTCLIEYFLKCGDASSRWELAAFVTAVILLAAVVGFTFLFSFSCLQREEKEEEKKTDGSRKKKYAVAVVAAGLGLAAAGIVAAAVLFTPSDEETGYERVAEFLTGDTRLGPIEYGGRIYVPVNQVPQVDENWVPRGYLAERGQDCSTRFYRMTAASLLYTDGKGGTDRIQVTGDTDAVYVPVESVNLEGDDNDVCVLWDEDWEKESAYSHEPTGYTVCGRDLLEGLRMQFPEVTFRVQDFTSYDAVFTIRSYDSAEKLRTDETVMGQWEGCILVKDKKFYFGSYENPISGICLEQLKNVIGGNKT